MANSAPKHGHGSKRRCKSIGLSDDESDRYDEIEKPSDSTGSCEPCLSDAKQASQIYLTILRAVWVPDFYEEGQRDQCMVQKRATLNKSPSPGTSLSTRPW